MIRYNITRLENGKYYGECCWKNKKAVFNVDVVSPDEAKVEIDLHRGVMQLMQNRLREFLRWRYNSIDKAERHLYKETIMHMNHLHDVANKLGYTNMQAGMRILREVREDVLALKPKVTNYLWGEMEELIAFVDMAYYGFEAIEIADAAEA